MPEKYIASIDLGTTRCKTIIFNLRGMVVSHASRRVSSIYNRLGPGWVEQDCREWWKAICESSKKALQQAGIEPRDIVGIGVTSLRYTFVAVDKMGDPIRYAIPWNVKATSVQAEWIKNNIGADKIYAITGATADSVWGAPTIRYIVEHEPEVYKKAYKIIKAQDFVLYKLGASDFVEDYSQACSLLNLRKLSWDDELCRAIGISLDKLPRLVSPGIPVGKMSKEAAKVTGFIEGTPLIPGGGDAQCAAIGCGAINPNAACIVIGTAPIVVVSSDEPELDPQRRIVCRPHAYPNKYALESDLLTGGNAYEWFKQILYSSEKQENRTDSVGFSDLMNADVKKSPVGAKGLIFLPYLLGAASPYWNPEARGAFIGFDLSNTRADFVRSMVEGICMEIGKGLEVIENTASKVEEIRLSGGVCYPGSPWIRILTDICGKRCLLTKSPEATALGAAINAAVGCGVFASFSEAVKDMVELRETLMADGKAHSLYKNISKVHTSIYRVLAGGGIYSDLTNLLVELSNELLSI